MTEVILQLNLEGQLNFYSALSLMSTDRGLPLIAASHETLAETLLGPIRGEKITSSVNAKKQNKTRN